MPDPLQTFAADSRPVLAGKAGETGEAGELSHAQVWARAGRYAAWLGAQGMDPGRRVAVLGASHRDHVTALLGHYLAGLIHVPINTRYRALEVGHIVADSSPALAVTDEAGETSLRAAGFEGPCLRFGALPEGPTAASDLPPADTDALMIYTSGTTGPSKGVVLPRASVVANIEALTTLWRFGPDDRLVLALPLFHVHGLCIGVHGPLLHGGCIDLLDAFTVPAVVQAIARAHASGRRPVFMGVPTMYRRILEHLEHTPGDAETLATARLFTAGSAALPRADFEAFERLTGHRILERYGMSETLLTLSNPFEPGRRTAGCVGEPVPGCKARIVDDDGHDVVDGETGELWVQSNGIMRGYWNNEHATRQAFEGPWFRTGDVARRTKGGIALVGRRSVDILKSGGFKISAREIEEVLLTHPAVREVAIVGVPDPTWGQRITAVVVSDAPMGDGELLAQLAAHCRTQLSDYKAPRSLARIEALPRNALGKLQKHRLLSALADGSLAASG